jgi:aspartyl aminopeptidase
LENDQARFDSIFDGMDAETKVIQAREGNQRRFTEEEEIVYRVLSEASSPKTIFARCLLSRYHTMEALLSLYDQDCLRVVPLEDLDEIGNAIANERQTRLQESVQGEALSQARDDSIRSDVGADSNGVEELVDSAVHLLRAVSDDVSAAEPSNVATATDKTSRDTRQLPCQTASETISAVLASFGDTVALPQQSLVDQQVVSDSSSEEVGPSDIHAGCSTQSSVSNERTDVGNAAGSLNSYLLAPGVADKVAVVVLLIYLVCFAVLGPMMLENWFAALSSFPVN